MNKTREIDGCRKTLVDVYECLQVFFQGEIMKNIIA